MFRSKTLFIVGAGASQEAGLPTGIKLTQAIAERLDIRYDFADPYSPKTGDRAIAAALIDYARKESKDPNFFLDGAWKIRDAMPQAISIDNFVDAHSSNPGVVLCGKLGITQAILEAERNSKLYFDERSEALLNNTTLIDAKLINAKLSGADLTGADLTGADLTGADITGANLNGAKGVTKTQLVTAKGAPAQFP